MERRALGASRSRRLGDCRSGRSGKQEIVSTPCMVESVEEVVLVEKRCPECRRLFHECLRCHRGHVYCSDACRSTARTRSKRLARRRYQRDPEVAADRAAYMRARRAERRVTDQSAGKWSSEPTVVPPTGPLSSTSFEPEAGGAERLDGIDHGDGFAGADADAAAGDRGRPGCPEGGSAARARTRVRW